MDAVSTQYHNLEKSADRPNLHLHAEPHQRLSDHYSLAPRVTKGETIELANLGFDLVPGVVPDPQYLAQARFVFHQPPGIAI